MLQPSDLIMPTFCLEVLLFTQIRIVLSLRYSMALTCHHSFALSHHLVFCAATKRYILHVKYTFPDTVIFFSSAYACYTHSSKILLFFLKSFHQLFSLYCILFLYMPSTSLLALFWVNSYLYMSTSSWTLSTLNIRTVS